MTTQSVEGATTPRTTAPESQRGWSEAGDSTINSDKSPRAPYRQRLPTAYRLIMEPRKSKAPIHRDRRALTDARADDRDTPSTRLPVTLPSMRAVTAMATVPAPTSTQADEGERAPGDLLAERYRLIEPIGRGGMGAVWRARCLQLDADVAVKFIRPGCGVPDARERLLREARLAARVAHPAAVRVFDCCTTANGEPLLIMELLRGRSLSKAVAKTGPMNAVAAVQLMLPILGALAAAHREGVIHRDVKPSNILLLQDGRLTTPRLIDFGIACGAQGSGVKRLTAHDIAVGSAEYMAPEQLGKGTYPDERTDIWGACATLFEIVSGMRWHTRQKMGPRLRDSKPGQPARASVFAEHPGFWSIVARGLAKAPQDRWPTMSALSSALAEWALRTGVAWDVTRTSLAAYCLAPDGAAIIGRSG
jgi:eukaryotic-like serine/threonine-protein kinase